MSITNGGKPSTDHYQIGRGILRLDLFNNAGAPSGYYRDLGNATAFALNLEEETLDHEGSMAGLKVIDASVTLSKALKGSITLDSITSENQQLFYSADHVERTQTALANTGVTTGHTNMTVPRNSAGHWLPIYYDDNATPADADFLIKGSKDRAYGVSITAVETGDGVTTMVEGTDYEYDADSGQFFPIVGGAMDSGSDVEFRMDISISAYSGTVQNNTIREVLPLLRTVVRGRLSFMGENAQTGAKYEVFLNRVKLQADGDAQMIGDDFSELTLALTAETDEDYDSVAPTGRITRIPTVTG